MKLKEIGEAMASAAQDMVSVALACGTAGIVIGIFGQTGLGLKLSSLLVTWSGGSLMTLLILTMISAIILGMGLPTTGVYVILSVFVAPALVKLGILPMAAHLFVFYFGCLSAITPPVALASYAGATIAGADMNRTGFEAVKIGLAGFLLPFFFIFYPGLLWVGNPLEIVKATTITIIAITALAAGIDGVPYRNILTRVLFISGAIFLIDIRFFTDLLGICLVAIGAGIGVMMKKKLEQDTKSRFFG
jgi:TRAP-type uncharacterized transport system fused permease subunit